MTNQKSQLPLPLSSPPKTSLLFLFSPFSPATSRNFQLVSILRRIYSSQQESIFSFTLFLFYFFLLSFLRSFSNLHTRRSLFKLAFAYTLYWYIYIYNHGVCRNASSPNGEQPASGSVRSQKMDPRRNRAEKSAQAHSRGRHPRRLRLGK